MTTTTLARTGTLRSAFAAACIDRLFGLVADGLARTHSCIDSAVEIEALAMDSGRNIASVGAAGDQLLDFLAHSPATLFAAEPDPHQHRLCELRLAGLRALPDQAAFSRFFVQADQPDNVTAYFRHVRRMLDAGARRYWEKPLPLVGPRIALFAEDIARRSTVGRALETARGAGGWLGCVPSRVLAAQTPAARQEAFGRDVAPLFDNALVRLAWGVPGLSLFWRQSPLGFRAFKKRLGTRPLRELRRRVQRLVVDLPPEHSPVALHLLGRPAVPEHATARGHLLARRNAERLTLARTTLTELLKTRPADTLHGFALLDAMDGMGPGRITTLWAHMARTGLPGAPVVFRTMGVDSPVETVLPDVVRARFARDDAHSAALSAKDRSLYGGVHVYRVK